MEEAAQAAADVWTRAMVLELIVGFVLPLIYFAIIMTGAWAIGRMFERRHLASLAIGEAELRHIPATNLPDPHDRGEGALVSGSVVVANDLFKAWRARWRGLIGGNIRHYETLVMRGRREAVLRLKREADALGARSVCGVRLQTAHIGDGARAGGIEVLAYGTAVFGTETDG